MTCRSCESRIERIVGGLPHVESVHASAARGRVVVTSCREVPAQALDRAIRQAGYEIGQSPWLERDRVVWKEVLASAWIVVGLAFIAQLTGVLELASSIADISSGGILVAMLLGLAAGFSTCAILVGGLVLALSASYQGIHAEEAGAGTAALRPAMLFVGGRVVGYGILGAVLGILGATFTMPPQLTAALMIAVAIVMTILGTRLTGLSPRMAGWSPTLPMGLGRRLGLEEAGGGYSDARAAALGAASFFLPCGFTQAIQVYALSTGSPLLGGALLAAFALGTAPGLMALAGLPSAVSEDSRPSLLRFVGVVVLAFAVVNATAGLRLAGIGLPWLGVGTASAATLTTNDTAARQTQSLTTFQEARGYRPGNATIYSGRRTRWTIESKSGSSCAASLVIPSLRISRRLQLGPNVIELPALSAGILRYSCSMGMFEGTITVIDPPAGSDGA
jgi:sulfite exporter TauE/SafE/copper chaperone CopZ